MALRGSSLTINIVFTLAFSELARLLGWKQTRVCCSSAWKWRRRQSLLVVMRWSTIQVVRQSESRLKTP